MDEGGLDATLGCNDGEDNDWDMVIDAADPDCVFATDLEVTPICGNGTDDDEDGWIDGADPGCVNMQAPDEGGFDWTYPCNDGVDNDADGQTDAGDADCKLATDYEPPAASIVAPSGLWMFAITGGSFEMGCTPEQEVTGFCAPDEYPVHSVSLTHDFWIAEAEVTQAQYNDVIGSNPAWFAGCDDCPVEMTSWNDAALFANALSTLDGLAWCYDCVDDSCEAVPDLYGCDGYRLPTEAEWEYSARCGDNWIFAGAASSDGVAWTEGNSGAKTHQIATKMSNGCGLHDQTGNVAEWCSDYYSDVYEAGPLEDPLGPMWGTTRVLRGGAWSVGASEARNTIRDAESADTAFSHVGFRIVRTMP